MVLPSFELIEEFHLGFYHNHYWCTIKSSPSPNTSARLEPVAQAIFHGFFLILSPLEQTLISYTFICYPLLSPTYPQVAL